MKPRVRIMVVVLVAFLAIGAIGYDWTHSAKPSGISGGIVSDLQSDGLRSGSVRILRQGQVVASQQVQQGQTFRLTLKPGTYDLLVDSPAASCKPASIFIPAGEFLGLRIACKAN